MKAELPTEIRNAILEAGTLGYHHGRKQSQANLDHLRSKIKEEAERAKAKSEAATQKALEILNCANPWRFLVAEAFEAQADALDLVASRLEALLGQEGEG